MHAAFQVTVRLSAVTGVCDVIQQDWWGLGSCFHRVSGSGGAKGKWGCWSNMSRHKIKLLFGVGGGGWGSSV